MSEAMNGLRTLKYATMISLGIVAASCNKSGVEPVNGGKSNPGGDTNGSVEYIKVPFSTLKNVNGVDLMNGAVYSTVSGKNIAYPMTINLNEGSQTKYNLRTTAQGSLVDSVKVNGYNSEVQTAENITIYFAEEVSNGKEMSKELRTNKVSITLNGNPVSPQTHEQTTLEALIRNNNTLKPSQLRIIGGTDNTQVVRYFSAQ